MNPGSGHDSDSGDGERSKDVDKTAYAARDAGRHDKSFRTNEADPCNPPAALEQRGNPGDSEYNRSRKLGG